MIIIVVIVLVGLIGIRGESRIKWGEFWLLMPKSRRIWVFVVCSSIPTSSERWEMGDVDFGLRLVIWGIFFADEMTWSRTCMT